MSWLGPFVICAWATSKSRLLWCLHVWQLNVQTWSSSICQDYSSSTNGSLGDEMRVMRETRRERTAPQSAAGISQRKMMCFCLIGLAIVIEIDEAVDLMLSQCLLSQTVATYQTWHDSDGAATHIKKNKTWNVTFASRTVEKGGSDRGLMSHCVINNTILSYNRPAWCVETRSVWCHGSPGSSACDLMKVKTVSDISQIRGCRCVDISVPLPSRRLRGYN